jgi:phage-related protein
MASYVTISSVEYPFDSGISIDNTPAKRVTNFGDGYALHIPIGPVVRNYTASFNNRTTTEIDTIESFLINQKGEAFDIVVQGETIHVVVLEFTKAYQNGEVYSLSATFREYFN